MKRINRWKRYIGLNTSKFEFKIRQFFIKVKIN